MSHCIVFIHLGPAIPSYTLDALEQARLFNGCPIYLLAQRSAQAEFAIPVDREIQRVECESLQLTDEHQRFREVSTLDRTFRDGFWTFTTERFFYLESLMAEQRLENVFHIENDNLLYVDLGPMLGIFEQHYPALASTLDNDQRCVPGLVYARRSDALAPLTAFINGVLAKPLTSPVNDMDLLGAYCRNFGPDHLGYLPIVTSDYPHPLRSKAGHVPRRPQFYSDRVEDFGGIFDAAAIGQYLGGVDPRNTDGRPTIGFVNESCVFDPSVYTYGWGRDEQQRRVPYLRSASRIWRIHNLHIHSKNLGAFRSGKGRD